MCSAGLQAALVARMPTLAARPCFPHFSAAPEQRCEALFLFFHLLFSFLVPVVLLLWSSGASSGRRRPPPASATARLERHLQDGLGLLLQPAPAWGRLPPLAVRWAIMIVVFYALSCSLLMGNPA